jgi:hypothetical protein
MFASCDMARLGSAKGTLIIARVANRSLKCKKTPAPKGRRDAIDRK